MDTINIDDLPRYFWHNSRVFASLIIGDSAPEALCMNPDVRQFVSVLASKIDTATYDIYGAGARFNYGPWWQEHFTNDLWIAALLVSSPGRELEKIHLGEFFGSLGNLTANGMRPYSGPVPDDAITYQYGEQTWAKITFLREHLAQTVPFSQLSEAKQKNLIQLNAFLMTKKELGPEALAKFTAAITAAYPQLSNESIFLL